ncbi:MAG: nucleotide-binding protein [Candidatus Thorarchaeota archaeon]
MPVLVVIDTNFILVPAQFGVDIFTEAERVLERKVEFVVLASAVDEIEKKMEKATKRTEKLQFRIAKDLVARCRVVEMNPNSEQKDVDSQLLDYASSVEGVLATNDRELRQRARAKGVPVLFLRGKKILMLEGTVL